MAKNDLISRARCKAYILQMAKEHRPGWDCTRVSKQVLDQLDHKVKHAIIGSLKRHPSIGKTFTELQ